MSQSRKSSARQRIIETAEELFYAEGVRAVGIDRIIAEAKVAKMTLYNHFASKDELILAVLKYREEEFDDFLDATMNEFQAKGESRLEALFSALKTWFESPNFRGCSFINAKVELADPEHPASVFCSHHKRQFQKLIREIVASNGTPQSESVAAAIGLLVEGAIIMAVMQQSAEPAEIARQAALKLIAA
ncbi:MAG: TetR/AcrR family transcriptional regulator [Planctomycetaceae bacterium]|nr:TetR/AcrR family transcriptional regulator [Planctomycetaceae bacterium]